MMYNHRHLVKIFLLTSCSLLSFMIGSCEGCSCSIPSNLQDTFCASKYAAIIKVTKSVSSSSPSQPSLSPSSFSPFSSSSTSSLPPAISPTASHPPTVVNLSNVLLKWDSLRIPSPQSQSSNFESTPSDHSHQEHLPTSFSGLEIEGSRRRKKRSESIKLRRSMNRKEIIRETVSSGRASDKQGIEYQESNDGSKYQPQSYKVTIGKMYKSSSEAEKSSLIMSSMIHTRKVGTSCDLDLEIGKSYIIYGDVERDGSVLITQCHAIGLDFLADRHIMELMKIDREGLKCR